MSENACSCGFTASNGDELAEHLGEMFTSADDIGIGGVRHAEDARDVPGRACLCGFTGPDATTLDEHLLAAFAPPDGIGRDGRRHAARLA
jgi:hypothetical protein